MEVIQDYKTLNSIEGSETIETHESFSNIEEAKCDNIHVYDHTKLISKIRMLKKTEPEDIDYNLLTLPISIRLRIFESNSHKISIERMNQMLKLFYGDDDCFPNGFMLFIHRLTGLSLFFSDDVLSTMWLSFNFKDGILGVLRKLYGNMNELTHNVAEDYIDAMCETLFNDKYNQIALDFAIEFIKKEGKDVEDKIEKLKEAYSTRIQINRSKWTFYILNQDSYISIFEFDDKKERVFSNNYLMAKYYRSMSCEVFSVWFKSWMKGFTDGYEEFEYKGTLYSAKNYIKQNKSVKKEKN